MTEEKIFVKVTTYRGSVSARWRAPKTKRGVTGQMEKLLKLYHRCRQNGLLTRDMLAAIKNYASALKKLATALFVVKPELFALLGEIENTKPEDLEEEIVAEKVREHRRAVCSFCKVDLVYPAYVVYRRGTEVVRVSEPVGIQCLKGLYGKLNDLAVEIQARIEEIKLVDGKKSRKSDRGPEVETARGAITMVAQGSQSKQMMLF